MCHLCTLLFAGKIFMAGVSCSTECICLHNSWPMVSPLPDTYLNRKICPLPSIQISRVCIVGNCWQWANFTMGPNEQNQHFAELRQKVC